MIGVFFTSIPNSSEFYMELDANNQGVECLRVLNEIISDFDELLNEPNFRAVDNIQAIGSTYVGAIGLMPEYKILVTIEDIKAALNDWYELECRGTVKVKGKGEMTTYWLKGRKSASGNPNPRSQNAILDSAMSYPTHQPRGEKRGFFSRQMSSDSGKGGTKLLSSTSNTSVLSSLSSQNQKQSVERKASDGNCDHPCDVTQSPTSFLTPYTSRSPIGIARAYDQEHAHKIDVQMSMPTPPGSLSCRRNNIESPRDSRNPLRKFSNNSLTNCISTQGPPSETSSTYMRVDSPELPVTKFKTRFAG